MKFLGPFLLLLLVCISCNTKPGIKTTTDTDKSSKTTLVWQDTVIKLGNVKAGTTYHLVFKCRNTGKVPLIFQNIESTCGCTVIKKKITAPVLPSSYDSVEADFNMFEPAGHVERKIYVLTNTEKQFYILRIIADVNA